MFTMAIGPTLKVEKTRLRCFNEISDMLKGSYNISRIILASRYENYTFQVRRLAIEKLVAVGRVDPVERMSYEDELE